MVVALELRRHEVVAESGIHGQLVGRLPVVLPVERIRVQLLVRLREVRKLGVRDVAEQEIAEDIAGERIAERHRAPRRRHVQERVPHRHRQVDAELPLVRAAEHRERIGHLRDVGPLILRQKVRRSQAVAARAEVHAGQSAGDARVVREAQRDAGLAEGILNGRGVRLVVSKPQFVQRARTDCVVPAGGEGSRGHLLVAPRRRAGAVGDAAEIARNEPLAVRLKVAREHVVAVAEMEIGAAEIALRIIGGVRGPEIIVRACGIRQRKEIHQLTGDGIDAARRDRVVGEREARQRIADRAGEHTVPLSRRGHDRRPNHTLREARRFDVAEKEGLAARDRAAQVAAEVVLLVVRFDGALADREEIVRVELVVPQELVGGAVHVVGARFGGHADGRAGRFAELGRVRARHHLELANGIDRRPRYLGGQFLDVLGNRVIVEAVEQEVVLQRSDAVNVDASRPAGRRAAGLLGITIALDTGREAEQVVPVAQRERQPGDFRLADDGAKRRLLGVDQRRHGFHADALLETADAEGEIEAGALTGVERHPFADLPEAL